MFISCVYLYIVGRGTALQNFGDPARTRRPYESWKMRFRLFVLL